jgi:hypothetical protein
MTQPPPPGAPATGTTASPGASPSGAPTRSVNGTANGAPKPADDGFGPTRFERSSNSPTAAPAAPAPQPGPAGQSGYDPTGARPLVTGTAAAGLGGSNANAYAAAGQTRTVPGVKAAPAKAARPRGPRRARLQLRNINPWTVFKFSSVLGVFLFLAWLIIVMLLFGVLNAAGVISSINNSVTTINGPGSQGVITGGRVFVYGLIIGAVNAILFIAIATVGSYVYNLCADLVGGVEVTLSERDA